MTTQNIQESNEVYRKTHEAYPNYFRGFSIRNCIADIGQLIKNSNIKTVTDYGCGQAGAWKLYDLKDLWQLQKVHLYDPGVEIYAQRPLPLHDLVICIDVMEHIPEHLVDKILTDICRSAKKAVFFNISTRPASKQLIDGSNAHATVKPRDWWQAKINKIDKLVIAHYQ